MCTVRRDWRDWRSIRLVKEHLLQPEHEYSLHAPTIRYAMSSAIGCGESCSHGSAGPSPSLKKLHSDRRPQVRTPDGFVLRRTGGYKVYQIALGAADAHK